MKNECVLIDFFFLLLSIKVYFVLLGWINSNRKIKWQNEENGSPAFFFPLHVAMRYKNKIQRMFDVLKSEILRSIQRWKRKSTMTRIVYEQARIQAIQLFILNGFCSRKLSIFYFFIMFLFSILHSENLPRPIVTDQICSFIVSRYKKIWLSIEKKKEYFKRNSTEKTKKNSFDRRSKEVGTISCEILSSALIFEIELKMFFGEWMKVKFFSFSSNSSLCMMKQVTRFW